MSATLLSRLPGVFTLVFCAGLLSATPVISEFLASNNGSLQDQDGEHSDWLELHNPAPVPAELSGWYLTDDAENLTKWQLPAVTLPPGGFLLVFCSGKDRATPSSELHTNFSLSAGGEYLALVEPDGITVSHEYAPSFPAQLADVSYGLPFTDGPSPVLDTASPGFFPVPTPGAANGTNSGMLLPGRPEIPEVPRTITERLNLSFPVPEGWRLRYTLNGTPPTNRSSGSTGLIRINGSALLQVVFEDPASGRISLPSVAHFEKLDPSLASYHGPDAPFTSALPILVLNSFSNVTEMNRNKVPASMMVFDREASGYASLGNLPSYVSKITVKARGQSSYTFPKKSYSLELTDNEGHTRPDAILGIPGEDFALISCWNYDKSFLRNTWIYNAANDFGFPAPKARLVEVFCNFQNGNLTYHTAPGASSNYRGVYVLVQRMRIDKDTMDMRQMSPAATSLPEISGGYILKVDKLENNEDRYQWITNRKIPGGGRNMLILDRPKLDKLNSAQTDYFRDYFQAFEDALYNDAASGFATRHYAKYIDPESWARMNLFNLFPKNKDFPVFSTYYHKPRGRRLAGGPLWDFDRSSHNTSVDDTDDQYYDTWAVSDAGHGIGGHLDAYWWGKLFSDYKFRQIYADTYRQLRDGVFSEQAIVSRLESLLAEFQPQDYDNPAFRDYRRWYGGQGNITTFVNDLKTWLIQRGRWLDIQFGLAPEPSAPGGLVPAGTQITLTVPAQSTVYYTLDGRDPRKDQTTAIPGAIRYNNQPITITETTRLRACAMRRGNFNAPVTNWGGLVSADYFVNESYATRESLAIAAIQPSPRPPSPTELAAEPEWDATHYQWLELVNRSQSVINLKGLTFEHTNPVSKLVLPAHTLAPGERAFVVKNAAAFQGRHGEEAAALVAAEWPGDRGLSLISGKLHLFERDGLTPVAHFKYDTRWVGDAIPNHRAMIYAGPDQEDASYKIATNWQAGAETDDLPGAGSALPRALHAWHFSAADPASLLTPETGTGSIHANLAPGSAIVAGTGQGFATPHLRLNHPLGSEFTIHIPTSGYENIAVSVLTRRSGSGAGVQHWSYSLDGSGFLPLADYHPQDADPQRLDLPLGAVGGVENNKHLALRVSFEQGAGGTGGNHRWDDLVVVGTPIPGYVPDDPTGFEAWLREHFTAAERENPEISGTPADPDADGLPNLVEYALGLDPRAPSRSDMRVAQTTAGDPALLFTRPTGLVDLDYQLWMSEDLSTWTQITAPHVETTGGPAGREQVLLGASGVSHGRNRLFLRLQIVRHPE